jgi:uncharacterized hydrophobic protein (TIGR00271 family)
MEPDQPRRRAPVTRSLIPKGRIGLRGRDLELVERSRILDELFFEGRRRAPYLSRYVALMVFSAAIAALGMMNDSAAVVIGAMLIAPLMTPIMAFAAAIVQAWGRRSLLTLGVVAGGAVLGILMGYLMTSLIPRIGSDTPLPDEVLARTAPNLADLGIAILAGAAGAYVTVRSEAGSALPGVGIAVALVPPLAAVGITLVAERNDLARGALLLFLTNFAAITLAAGVTFALAGFVPRRDRLRRRAWSLALTVVVLLTLAIPLGRNSITKVERSIGAADAARAVAAWDPTLEIERIEIDPKQSPMSIEIDLSGIEMGEDPQRLADDLARRRDKPIDLELLFFPTKNVTGAP